MPTNYNGKPGSIIAPTAKINISSSTNASPIVVTTSSAHGVQPGDMVAIAGHDNNGANGYAIAFSVTSTTVTLTGTTGTSVGTATGTLRRLAIGPEYPMPNDGEKVDAASVQPPFSVLGDRTAFLWAMMGWTLTVYDDGIFTCRGRTVHRAPYRPADAATIVIDQTMGDVVILPNPASNRIVQLRTSVFPPISGERIRIVMPPSMADGLYFTVRLEDGTDVAEMHGHTVTEGGVDRQANTWIEVQFEATVWRGLTATGRIVAGAGW